MLSTSLSAKNHQAVRARANFNSGGGMGRYLDSWETLNRRQAVPPSGATHATIGNFSSGRALAGAGCLGLLMHACLFGEAQLIAAPRSRAVEWSFCENESEAKAKEKEKTGLHTHSPPIRIPTITLLFILNPNLQAGEGESHGFAIIEHSFISKKSLWTNVQKYRAAVHQAMMLRKYGEASIAEPAAWKRTKAHTKTGEETQHGPTRGGCHSREIVQDPNGRG